ncbi:hypothetical protein [Tellurirhabdus bombi]|uniref:hypothetical protein n=1 Tax=Tellurirhabdus bombi TaxID=2907205 RepID=UPI001F206055|nr:hypothetical protein [Tellurirhabdus bombi]
MKKIAQVFAKALLMFALVPAIPYTPTHAQAVSTSDSEKAFEAAIYPAATPLKLWLTVERSPSSTNPLRIELVDKKNKVLHASTLPKKGKAFQQQFDLSQVKDDTYTLRITDGNKLVEKSFKLSTPGLSEQLPQRLVSLNN